MGHLCNVLIQKSPRGSINVSRLIKHKSLNVKTDTFILFRLHLYRFLFNEKEEKVYFSAYNKMPMNDIINDYIYIF